MGKIIEIIYVIKNNYLVEDEIGSFNLGILDPKGYVKCWKSKENAEEYIKKMV